jgi:hypothetical protein
MSKRRRLYLFSPLPPQRNGLADYIVEYLPYLTTQFDVYLVSESGLAAGARQALAHVPALTVIDEAHFLARQPEADAQTLYNVGNNVDCAYMLDYVHRWPGVVIVHDVSLFYLHQVAAHSGRLNSALGSWLVRDQYLLPDDLMGPDGSLTRTPGTLYQECLMLREIVASAQGLMVHTNYAEQRLRGGALDIPLGSAAGKPLVRIPHFVLPPPKLDAHHVNQVLERFDVQEGDFLMLVPGFLTGNKMLYEVMVAYDQVLHELPNLKLLFAGEERASEYPLSQRISQRWPHAQAPKVTGYLDAMELDILLGRADLSFVLRYPTYGESSGILPRAAMGGGDVVTVDIGAYPEFESPLVTTVAVGRHVVSQLVAAIQASYERWSQGVNRGQRRLDEARRLERLLPHALYGRLKGLLDASWGMRP